MNKPSKTTNYPGKPTHSATPRTVRVAALLNTAATLGCCDFGRGDVCEEADTGW